MTGWHAWKGRERATKAIIGDLSIFACPADAAATAEVKNAKNARCA
jgi:hypothetical protein